MALYFHNS
ncbi:hypothetical protein ECEC4402_4016, partial [Escherichia coli EC4402]